MDDFEDLFSAEALQQVDFEDLFAAEALQLWANDSVPSPESSQATAPIPTSNDVALIPAPQPQDHIRDNHAWCSDPTYQPQEPIFVNNISDLGPLTQNKRKSKGRKSPDTIPGCLTITSTEAEGPKKKRSKFPLGRKEEVAKTRIIGACLRCKQLKISCSEIWPCPPCRRSKSPCYGRAPGFRWMDTVSCSFSDVDIYAIDLGCTLEQLTAKFINRKLGDFGDVRLGFESEVRWDLDAMVSEFAGWMSHTHSLPASTSRVGILSSAKFTQLVSSLADVELIRTFRLLVESSSVLYNYDGQPDFYWKNYPVDDVKSICSYAGTSVLRHLERVLSNLALAETSLQETKALFLILFGTIIAVGYSRPVGHNQGQPGFSARSYGEAQQQLLRILSHHMVQIAEKTSILAQEADKIHLIERANRLWDRQAMFEWNIVVFSSCKPSSGSIGDPGDGGRNGSGFNSPTWEDVLINGSIESNLPSTLHEVPFTQEALVHQPDQLLNSSSTNGGPLNPETEASTYLCSQETLAHATDKRQYAQASLDIPAPSVHSALDRNVQLHASQSKFKRWLQYSPHEPKPQFMQHRRCLECHVIAMRPVESLCRSCTLQKRKNLLV